MAVAVRGVGTVASNAGAISPGLPSGTAVGDILVMFLETNNQAITAAGWTEAPNSPQSDATDATRLTVLWRRATGSDATTTSDSGNHQIGRIIGFSGCVTSGDPFNVTNGTTEGVSDTTGSIPGATTTVDGCMVIAACCTTRDANSTTNFSGWTNASLASITEQIDNTTTAGLGGGIGVATGIKTTAGTYNATTVTYATASRKGLWTGALAPDSGQSITGNAITVTESLPNAVVNRGTVTISANAITVAETLPNAEVQNAASTQSITANALTVSEVLTGGAVSTANQISADALTVTPTLPGAVNVSLSIVGASLVVVAELLPASFVTTSYTITANAITVAESLPSAAVTPGTVSVTASYIQVLPTLPSAVSVYLGTQQVFASVLTLGTVTANWTVDGALFLVDGEQSVDGLTNSVLPGATITQPVPEPVVAPTRFPKPEHVRKNTIPAGRNVPRLVRPRSPATIS